jgi:hypothetical protein
MTGVELVLGYLFVAAASCVIAAKDEIVAAINAVRDVINDDFPVTEVDRGEIR